MMRHEPYQLLASHFKRSPDDKQVVSANERQILRLVQRQPGISRADITGRVELTQQSIYRIINQLIERKILTLEQSLPSSGRGQPSPALYLDAAFGYSVGISINTDIVGISLLPFGGEPKTRSLITVNQSMTETLELIDQTINRLRTETGLEHHRFFGIGVGIQGYRLGGTRFLPSLPLHEWGLIELAPLFAERFKVPIWVENGGNTAALCESIYGVGRHIQSFAYLSFNYGFGGGLIIDGDLFRGAHGNAAELGAMYEPDEESYHRPALQYLIEQLESAGIRVPSVDYLREHFDPRWPPVEAWVAEVTPAYNRVINALAAIFDPQAIVFGGQIPPKLAYMLIDQTNYYNPPKLGVRRRVPKLIVSELKSNSSSIGAAALPFKEMLF